ncbi:MAG: hypothetical protein AB8H79_25585 [Myxococcota bacterium]
MCPTSVSLPSPEERMLSALARLDSVGPTEALRRAVRLAFFARTVPDALVQQVLGTGEPDEGWRPTGDVRVSEHGDLVVERVNSEGAHKWVPATEDEVQAYFARASQRR